MQERKGIRFAAYGNLKKKRLRPGMLLCWAGFLLLLVAFNLYKGHKAGSINSELSSKVIVIDPGHGGIDGGSSIDRDHLEKDINLDIALRLKALLDESGAQVILTRESDVSLENRSSLSGTRYQKDLDARRRIINNSNADIYISIHTNCYRKNPAARGAIVFYSKSSFESEFLSKSIAAFIDNDVYIDYLGDDSIRTNIVPAGYYILRHAEIPGVLVEVGFLSNQKENLLLQEEKYRGAMAAAIYNGVMEYFVKVRSLPRPVKRHFTEIFNHFIE